MFVINVPYFNLDQIYNSRQAPRWIKIRESKYIVIYKDLALKIEQQKDRLIMSCSEDDFYNVWFEYFDLRTDYFELNDKIKRLNKKFKKPTNRGSGIHILRQDTFESYVFGKIVINAGYEKAHKAINHIAEVCGIEHVQSMREAGRITWYEFPTPERILENFDNLKKMGKINKWLKKLCEAIINDNFNIAENLMNSSGNELLKMLVLHEVDRFPLIGIEDTIEKNFDCVPEEFADWYLDKIENKSLVYMYILHHIMNPPEEIVVYGIS